MFVTAAKPILTDTVFFYPLLPLYFSTSLPPSLPPSLPSNKYVLGTNYIPCTIVDIAFNKTSKVPHFLTQSK